jgi:hypothetical protein
MMTDCHVIFLMGLLETVGVVVVVVGDLRR